MAVHDHSMLLLRDGLGVVPNLEGISRFSIFGWLWGKKTPGVIDNHALDSQVCPPSGICLSCFVTLQLSKRVCVLQNSNCPIYLIFRMVKFSADKYISAEWTGDLKGSVVDSRQSTAPWRSNERHYGVILFWLLVIRTGRWSSPDQACCPLTDKWLPLLKCPILLIWISGIISKTLKV